MENDAIEEIIIRLQSKIKLKGPYIVVETIAHLMNNATGEVYDEQKMVF